MSASNRASPGGGSVDGYTPEALRVGRALKHDFEKSGIHLPEGQRSRLTGLIDLERRIGMQIGKPCPLISQALAFTLGAICRSLSFDQDHSFQERDQDLQGLQFEVPAVQGRI